MLNTTPRQDQWRLLILDGHDSHTPVDFMLHCRQHKVYLLYLPPHTSHVLQPLDLAPFSVVKSRYRDQIHALSALDDATPVKKERFITSYNHARNEGLSARNIRAGWKASGLCPYNPQLVLNSSQVLGRPVTPPQRNQTLEVADQVVNTPHSARDLHFSQQLLRRSENIPRPTRMLIEKAGKAIDNANARAALHEAESDRLRYQLDRLKSNRTRKRIQIDPNERYSNAETIEAAIDRAAEIQAQQESNAAEHEAKRASEAAEVLKFQSMCLEWQI